MARIPSFTRFFVTPVECLLMRWLTEERLKMAQRLLLEGLDYRSHCGVLCRPCAQAPWYPWRCGQLSQSKCTILPLLKRNTNWSCSKENCNCSLVSFYWQNWAWATNAFKKSLQPFGLQAFISALAGVRTQDLMIKSLWVYQPLWFI